MNSMDQRSDWDTGSAVTLEITAHRFGGTTDYPRTFGPTIQTVPQNGPSYLVINSATTASLYIRVALTEWAVIDDEWLSCMAQLEDINGAPLGRRPVAIFDRPYDIPTHTSFGRPHPEVGTFILGFRKA